MRTLPIFMATAALTASVGCGTVVSTQPQPAPEPTPTPAPMAAPSPWSRVGKRPGPRSGAAAVVDAKRDRMIVFGGGGNDLWAMALGGSSKGPWSQLLVAGDGPPPGTGMLAIDDVKDTLVVFANDSLDQAWTAPLDGSAPWSTVVFANGPAKNLSWSIAADPVGRNLYAYSEADRSLWTAPLDGGSWTELPSGPELFSDRDRLVVDQPANRLLLLENTEDAPQVFALSLDASKTWTRLDKGKAPFGGHADSTAWDPAHRRFLVAAGASVDALDVTDPSGLWTGLVPRPDALASRDEATSAFDAQRARWILFGGRDSLVHDDTWALDLSATPTWFPLEASNATYDTAVGEALGYLPSTGALLRFGGNESTPSPSTTFTLANGDWSSLGDKPPSSFSRSAGAWAPATARFITFGGASTPGSNPLRALDPSTASWEELPATGAIPSPRLGHSMVSDDSKDRILVFGGVDPNDDTHFLDDLWEYAPSTNTWSQIDVPGHRPLGRARHAAAFDAEGKRMFMVGGDGKLGAAMDTWVLELVPSPHWTQLATKGVTFEPTGDVHAAYDASSKKLVVVDLGTIDDGTSDETPQNPVAYTLSMNGEPTWARYCQKGLRPGSIDRAVATKDGLLFTSKGSTWRFDPTVAPCE